MHSLKNMPLSSENDFSVEVTTSHLFSPSKVRSVIKPKEVALSSVINPSCACILRYFLFNYDFFLNMFLESLICYYFWMRVFLKVSNLCQNFASPRTSFSSLLLTVPTLKHCISTK